jgi:hypothetical protein
MRGQLHSPSADGLERALAVVFEAVLRRREGGQDQAKMLRLLRSQLDRVLLRRQPTEMPWRQLRSEPV